MKKSLSSFLLSLLIITHLCCQEKIANQKDSIIRTPIQTNDGWQTASLANVNIDSAKLQIMMDRICDNTYKNIHSILIIKNDKLVFEQYFPGYKFKYEAKEFKGEFTDYNQYTIHNLASVTKSITSVLFGIALDQGLIDKVDEKLFKFFPKYADLNDSLKDQISLEHLLTMTSGLKWNEQDVFYSEAENDIIQLFIVPDPVKYILSKPVIYKPGTSYYYNGGGTNLLGKIIQETSELKLDTFAQKYLFDQLGIKQYEWIHINSDVVYASGDLKLRPRDMAKIGFIMLNKGVWESKQIISSGWIEKSTAPYVHFNANEGYGYQWWTKKYELGNASFHSFSADGWGGQNIIVFPGLDLIVVLTEGNYTERTPNEELIYRYILPSIDNTFKYDFEKIKNEAPISESFEIIKPSNTVTSSIAGLSGHWYGMGDFIIADQLIVEKIDSAEATVLYSWGNHPRGYFKNGWIRTTADVDDAGRIKFTLDAATLTFELDPHEDLLIGYYEKGNILSKLIMNRL